MYTNAVLLTQLQCFMDKNPDVDLHLHLLDSRVDLISEGFDAAVRIGKLDDSGLYVKKIGTTVIQACASPSYIQKRGMPKDFEDLSNHDCLRYNNLTSGAEWAAFKDGKEFRKRVHGRWTTNQGDINKRLALSGEGIAVLPDFIIGDAFETGALVPVLNDFLFYVSDIHIVYPQKRHMPASLRALIDHLAGA
ncbi:MAG: substrate binding domain-containing protein [Pseudomonadota bacterium]